MVRRVLFVLFCGLLTVFMASCGQTYELQSITIDPASPNIEGIGTSQAFTVTAHYSNTKTQDVTAKSSFQVGASSDVNAPMTALMVNGSGIAKAVGGACTWVAEPTDSPINSKFAFGTSPYTVTATYSGFTAVAFVSVNSLAGCFDPSNPPPTGFPGD
jgi:hypothetical protein